MHQVVEGAALLVAGALTLSNFCIRLQVDQMIDRGVMPTVWTYNAALKVDCYAGDFEQALQALQGMMAHPDTQPNQATWHVVLSAAQLNHRQDVVHEVRSCLPLQYTGAQLMMPASLFVHRQTVNLPSLPFCRCSGCSKGLKQHPPHRRGLCCPPGLSALLVQQPQKCPSARHKEPLLLMDQIAAVPVWKTRATALALKVHKEPLLLVHQIAAVPVREMRATALALKVVMMMTCLGAISEHSITASDFERIKRTCVVNCYVWLSLS